MHGKNCSEKIPAAKAARRETFESAVSVRWSVAVHRYGLRLG